MGNIKSFPNNQDTYIGAEDVMMWLHGRTSGVFGADGNASVSALSTPGMAVQVSDGIGWISNGSGNGVAWWNDTESETGEKMQLTIEHADGVLNRIDRIVVEWKTTNYVDYPEIKVLKGEPESSASAPSLTNNSTIRQISLAQITVSAGTTEITSSMITDERLDNSVCGLVTESVTVDTGTMQRQFESLLNTIRTELENLNNGTESLLKSGGTMTGTLTMGAEIAMGGNKVTGLGTPTEDTDAVTKGYADNKLPKAGGDMTGAIAMGGNKVTGLGAPADDGDAANKAYVDGKHLVFGITIPASGWEDWGNGFYGQIITIPGISENDIPHIAINDWSEAWYTVKEEYSKIGRAWSTQNTIAFQCYQEYPSVDIPILVEVNR